MNLRNLSDDLLLHKTKELAKTERELTINILHHLREVERRSLFALSYSSLFEYAVKELRYSEGAAQRRISSMRLLKELPEMEEKVASGKISLSVLAQTQSFFKHEKTKTEDKVELLKLLEGKSTRQVERELVIRSSEPERLVREKLRPVSQTHTEVKLLVDEKFLKDIEELRGLLGHSKPNASLKDILAFAVEKSLHAIRPKAPKEKSVADKKVPAPKVFSAPAVAAKVTALKHSRYIAQEVRRQVWQRDAAQCTYTHNGQRCCSKHALELDHIHPHAMGGENTAENLRLRCRVHNHLAAVQSFGKEKVASFVSRMK